MHHTCKCTDCCVMVKGNVFGNSCVCVCTERTIKIDKVEAAAVQRYSAEAKEQSRRLQARANGAAAVDDVEGAVQEGVDQASDAAQEVTDQVADGELQHLAAYPSHNPMTYTRKTWLDKHLTDTSKTLLDKQDMLPSNKHSTNSAL